MISQQGGGCMVHQSVSFDHKFHWAEHRCRHCNRSRGKLGNMSEWKIVLVAVHILRISLMSQASELKNGREFPDSLVTRESVESFISKVQNIEPSKTPLNYHVALGDDYDDRTIHTNGRKKKINKRRRRKKKRKANSEVDFKISNAEMSKINKFIGQVCKTTMSREIVSRYCRKGARATQKKKSSSQWLSFMFPFTFWINFIS